MLHASQIKRVEEKSNLGLTNDLNALEKTAEREHYYINKHLEPVMKGKKTERRKKGNRERKKKER